MKTSSKMFIWKVATHLVKKESHKVQQERREALLGLPAPMLTVIEKTMRRNMGV